jgi:flagellar biosynthesis protein FlhG
MSNLVKTALPKWTIVAEQGRETAPNTQLIAIASGKGGVGKTWLSISLAQSLALQGRRVLLVDLDLGLANVDIQLGLMPEHDLAAVLMGRRSLTDVIVRYSASASAYGVFDVLPGRSGAASLAVLDISILDCLLKSVRRLPDYDVVLVDLSAGIDPATRFLAASADTLLVVSTDEPTALADAYAVLKLQARDRDARPDTCVDGSVVKLVINQVSSLARGQQTYDILARACKTFLGRAPQLAGVIRRDVRVPESIRRQATILTRHPNAMASEDVSRLAKNLLLQI